MNALSDPNRSDRNVARLLDAASDPTRLSIVFLLARGPLNVGEIAGHFPRISRPAVSHHLRVLRDAGILDNERQGQEIYYRLDRARIVGGLHRIADEIEACCPPEAQT